MSEDPWFKVLIPLEKSNKISGLGIFVCLKVGVGRLVSTGTVEGTNPNNLCSLYELMEGSIMNIPFFK